MVDFYSGKFLVAILTDNGSCCEKEIYNDISYKELYNKFKDKFSEEIIKSAWLYDSGSNDNGEILLCISIGDIL